MGAPRFDGILNDDELLPVVDNVMISNFPAHQNAGSKTFEIIHIYTTECFSTWLNLYINACAHSKTTLSNLHHATFSISLND